MSIHDIKTFISSIQKIEGPIYAALLTPYSEYPTFPVILNLGDDHSDQDFCYPSCHTTDNCQSLESFSFFDALSKFASENDIIVDFFFEHWGVYEFTSTETSALVTISQNISELKKTFEKTIRFHFVDTRRGEYDEKRSADSIILLFFQFFIEYGDTFYEHIEWWFAQQVKKFPEFDRENLINSMIDILKIVSLEDYFKIPLIKKFSRTYHEFKQTPKEVQQRLLDKHQNLYKFGDKIIHERLELINLLNELKKNNTTIEAQNYPKLIVDNGQTIWHGINNVFLLDIYTICRILKEKAEWKFAIIYSGDFHRERIQKILEPFYKSEDIYREISPKCIKKDADEKIAKIVNATTYDPSVTFLIGRENVHGWLVKNENGTSLFEMAFSSHYKNHNKAIAKELVETMDDESLLNFRSSKNSSIFDLTVENNLDEVLKVLFTKIPKNQVPKGLIIKSLFHFANACLRVLCNNKYNPIESVKISGTTVNSLVAAIYLNNEDGVGILSSAINDPEFIKIAEFHAQMKLQT